MTRFLLCPAAFLSVVIGGSCMVTSPSAPVGYVEVPLTAAGAGGAIYRLPPTARLGLSNASFAGFFLLDGDAPSMTVHVPPGDYTVSLIDDAGDTTQWPLIRENPDGSTMTVPATLDLTPAISVAENQMTALVIRFHIVGVGPVSFSVGSVQVSVEVDGTAASSVVIQIVAPSLVAGSVGYDSTTPAALRPRLPALGNTGDSYVLTAHTVGAWSMTQTGVICAPVTVTIDATGPHGLAAYVAEALPAGTMELCVLQGDPQSEVVINFSRQGSAITPLLSDLTAQRFFLSSGVVAIFTASVFDGTTLHLENLLGALPALVGIFGEIDAQISTVPGTGPNRWYVFSESGNGTLGLTPQ